jgi:hypothetical protein
LRTGRAIGSRSPSRRRCTLGGPVAPAVRCGRRTGRATTKRTRRRRVAVSAPHVERLRALRETRAVRLEAPGGRSRHTREARVGRTRPDGVHVTVEGRGPAPLPAPGHAREAGVIREHGAATKYALEHRRHTSSHAVVLAHEVSHTAVKIPQGAHGRRAVATRAVSVTRGAARRTAAAIAAVAAPPIEVGTTAAVESKREATHDGECCWRWRFGKAVGEVLSCVERLRCIASLLIRSVVCAGTGKCDELASDQTMVASTAL